MNPAENPWPPHMEEAPPPSPAPVATSAPFRPVDQKNPLLAAFLSLFPGVGHIYDGLYLRGLTFFVIFFSMVAIADRANNPIFVFAAIFFGLFNIIDAYRQAVLINYGYAQDLGLLDRPKSPRPGQGGLAAGVVLSVVGALALADRYLNVDIERLLDLWPFALVLIGAWLIWGAIRERTRESAL